MLLSLYRHLGQSISRTDLFNFLDQKFQMKNQQKTLFKV